MKNAVFASILALLLAGCSPSGKSARSHADGNAQAAPGGPSGLDEDGGADGGGGDGLTDNKLSPADTEALKANAKFLLRAIFNYQMSLTKDQLSALIAKVDENPEAPKLELAGVESLYSKLFPGGEVENLNSKLADSDVEWREDGACEDLHGEAKDGSALNTGDKPICLSQDRLDKKMSQNTVGVVALALYAHEVGHRLETSEEESVALQWLVGESLGSGNIEGLMTSLAPVPIRMAAKLSRTEFEKLLKSNLADNAQTCLSILNLENYLKVLAESQENLSGLRRYTPAMEKQLADLRSAATALTGYCNIESAGQVSAAIGALTYDPKPLVDSETPSVPIFDKVELKTRLPSMQEAMTALSLELEAIGISTIEDAVKP